MERVLNPNSNISRSPNLKSLVCPSDGAVDFNADLDDSTFTHNGTRHDGEEIGNSFKVIGVLSIDDVSKRVMILHSHTEAMIALGDPPTRIICVRSFSISES